VADIYIDADVAPEAEDLVSDAVDFIQGYFPGWVPSEANLLYIFLYAVANMLAPAYAIAGLAPAAIFRWFGANLMNLPPDAAAPASATVTFTVRDNLGYTIPDGTVLGLVGADGGVPFTVQGDVVIAAGATTGDALIVAVNPGLDGSGLSVVDLSKGDALDFVTAVVVDGITTGGQDDEDDDHYLNRLSQELELMAPRPILANDFATMMIADNPTVFRAVGLDGYDPNTNTWNNVGLVSVAGIAEDGSNLAQATKDAAQADLEARREINFVVHVIDPTRTAIDFDYVVTAYSGWDINDVKARIDAALASYADPSTWGTRSGEGQVPIWDNTAKVRYLEVATVIENIDGVNTIEDLNIGLAGGARGTADIDLPGAAPLATFGAVVSGVVNAP
jgi:hypothetical protein